MPLVCVQALAAGVNELPKITVSGQVGPEERLTAASAGVVLREQIENRPLLRPAELLETVPGLVVTQHSGDGKANQYFLRGFNLDHGTDVAIGALGLPVNQRSHAHGQGYSDLNFLIPELVDQLIYRKGPYLASDGDFATAGAVEVDYVDALDRPLATVEAGSHGYRRALVAGSRPVALSDGDKGTLLMAAETSAYAGPWTVSEGLRKQNLLVRYSQSQGQSGWRASLIAYRAHWTATDQIPERAVAQGLMGAFDSLDPTAGGRTDLTALTWDAKGTNDWGPWKAQAHLARYGLDLYSNFTYAMDNPVMGDQFRQSDQRTRWGGDLQQTLRYSAWSASHATTLGTQLRQDRVGDLGLALTQAREVHDTVRHDRVRETSLSAFVDQASQWTPWLRTRLGLRADHFDFRVASDTAANSGRTTAGLASPKLSVTVTPRPALALFANWGRGFHSNDARGTVIRVDPDPRSASFGQAVDPVTPLARALASEVGVTWTTPELHISAALWSLRLQSELVYVGDAGTTEAGRPSRRHGLELAAVWRPTPHWFLDADLTVSRARHDDDNAAEPFVEGAVRHTLSAGLSYTPEGRWRAGLRLRHIGPRQLTADGTQIAASSTVLNGQFTYQIQRGLSLSLQVLNLCNRRFADMVYVYESRLPGEAAAATTDVHWHPAEGRSLRVGLQWTL